MGQLYINKGVLALMKKIISLLSVFALAATAVNINVAAEAPKEKITVYVSPGGADVNPGTIEKPLKTLEGAKNKVSQLKKESDSAIEVVFREGEYRFSQTVNFTAQDSGTEENPIVYKAYDGENVEFKGSVEVDSSKGKMVTDSKILARLYETVRDKVVCFDLKELGLNSAQIRQSGMNDGWRVLVNGEVNGIYLDDEEQIVAQWPNGDGEYTRWENAVDGTTIEYTDTEPNRWGEAKNFWLGGYNTYDFYYIRQSVTKVDTEEKTISVYAPTTSTQFTSHQSRRWKAFNLLEEIDIPGEYYIDPENMKLYLYPTKSLKDTKMEISVLGDAMLKLNQAENITFDGITFTQTRGGVIEGTNVKNIDVVNCTIKDVLGHAIVIKGTQNAQTDGSYWQVCDIDGSYDCDITGNIFTNIGGSAIELHGGNVDTLEKSNNVISDNLIYRVNQNCKNNNAILLWGVGHTVINNNISRCPFQAIRFYGNDMVIQYNEIYNVNQESDDCGAIYCGRNSLHQGTDISYNFIHDLQTTEELVFGFQSAIYWDDSHVGISAHHNIIKNARVDLASNGSIDCNWSENTSIDIVSKKWHFINGGYSVNHNSGSAAVGYKFSSYILNPELYYERYPNLKEIFSYSSIDPELGKFNSLKNNLSVNSCEATTGTNTLKYGDISGNAEVEECNDFVDPEKLDYRIKSNSETAKKVKGILTDEFDIEQIGLENNVELNEQTAPFRQIYPQNGATAVQCSSIDFKWENALGATKYRLTVATDPEFKNIVYDEDVSYNVQKVDGLSNNTVYYWKVKAINNSRDLLTEWNSKTKVYSFMTAKFDKIDSTYLNEEIEKLSQNIETIDEGEKPGQYPVGTVERFKKMIKRANLLKNSKLGIVRQAAIDAMTNSLSSAMGKIGSVNRGFLNISEEIADASKWNGKFEVKDGAYTVKGDGLAAKQAGTFVTDKSTGSCIYSFDAKVDTANWAIIALAKYIDMVPYSAACTGYSLCIKNDLIELQKSTGTAHTVDVTVDKSFANDGKYHNVQFGFVNIGIGNLVVLYVDGESWMEYLDVSDTAIKVNCGISMYVNSAESESISIKSASAVSDSEEFNKLFERGLYKAVKEVLAGFESEVMLFQTDANKIFTPKGVYDTSYAPNSVINGELMIAFDKVDDIWGVETLEENGSFYIVSNGEKQRINGIGEKNGYPMASVADIFTILDRENVASANNDMLIDGNIIYMNNVEWLNKATALMELLKIYKSDYLF